jgi:hypothetical protein
MMATANQSKKENMIWGLSLQGWEDVMRLSLVFAGGAAVFIGLSTWFVVKLQRDEIRLSNERIATSELETARLKKELGPRNLNWNDFVMAIKGAAQVQLEILYVADDADSMELAQQIQLACSAAGWGMPPRSPIQRPADWSEPLAMAVDGQPKGVTVVSRYPTPADGITKAILAGLGQGSAHSDGPHAPPVGTVRIVIAPKR